MSMVRALVQDFVLKPSIVPTLPDISAVIIPESQPFFQGGTLEDIVPNWDEIIAPGNYLSNVGDIQEPVITFLGDIVDETTPFVAGQSAGYSITVNDDAGSPPFVLVFGPNPVLAVVPAQVNGLIATAGNGQVSLVWSPPTLDGGSVITDYRIDRNISGAGWTVVSDGVGTDVSYVDKGLANGDAHQYRVSAINAAGSGPVSRVSVATPSGDVTPPVISETAFDDTTKTITLSVTESCSLIVATHLATDVPSPDGTGGWSGETIETFTQAVTGTGFVTLTFSDETGQRISYYARDAAGNDSAELITEIITFADGDFFDDFMRADEPLETSVNWSAFSADGLHIVSGNADSLSGNQNAARYTGTLANDQYIEVTIANVNNAHWVYMRATDFDNCIAVQIRADGTVRVYERVAGDNGFHSGNINFSTAKTVGDVFRIEADGTEITVAKNGIDPTTKALTATHTSGDIGVGVGGQFRGFKAVKIGNLA